MDVEKDIHHTKKTVALLQFVMAVTEAMPPSALNAFANTFFVKMLKVIESGGLENAQCAALAYRVLAMLGKDKPELVISRMDFVQQLFETIAGVCLFIIPSYSVFYRTRKMSPTPLWSV